MIQHVIDFCGVSEQGFAVQASPALVLSCFAQIRAKREVSVFQEGASLAQIDLEFRAFGLEPRSQILFICDALNQRFHIDLY